MASFKPRFKLSKQSDMSNPITFGQDSDQFGQFISLTLREISLFALSKDGKEK